MFRKSKIEPVEKVKIVERYLAGEIGIQRAEKELGVDHHSIRNWISIYQYDGPTGLLNQPKNKSYSNSTVPVGFGVKSYRTRLIPATSCVIRSVI